jgi:hypothetical protein
MEGTADAPATPWHDNGAAAGIDLEVLELFFSTLADIEVRRARQFIHPDAVYAIASISPHIFHL